MYSLDGLELTRVSRGLGGLFGGLQGGPGMLGQSSN